MRKTIIVPPNVFFLVVPVAFPLLVAASGGLALYAFAAHVPRWTPRAAPLLPYGLLLLAAGAHDLWAGCAFFAAYLANIGHCPAWRALCPGAGKAGPHVFRQSHEGGAVLWWLLFMTLSTAAAGWSFALLGETPRDIRRFAVMAVVATAGLLLHLGASYAYRWGWSGDAVLRVGELPILSGRGLRGEIVAAGLNHADPSITVTVRCKHMLNPERNWRARAECRPERIPGKGLLLRFSAQMPYELDGASTFGVTWVIHARSGESGMFPNFFCVFSALPVFPDPEPPIEPFAACAG